MKPLLLGMSHWRDPLAPTGMNTTGDRIMRMVKMDEMTYLRSFDRMNLLPPSSGWDRKSARISGMMMRKKLKGVVVVLGRDVWEALGFSRRSPYFERATSGSTIFVLLPHPSGRNHFYNDPSNRRKVGMFLRGLVG